MNFSFSKIMGILNLTPDSFYDGNRYLAEKAMLNRVEQMLNEGADIIDIGGFSSRPGSELVTQDEESKRIFPAIEKILYYFPDAYLSVDTYRSRIAMEVVDMGVKMINDISGGELDKNMFKIIAKLQVPYVMMHMQGIPENMQDNPEYYDVVNDIMVYFLKKIDKLNQLNFDKIIIDPGFGFGKTLQHNFEILNRLDEFQLLKKPVLVGMSRKSMFYKLLQTNPSEVLNATSVGHTIALLKGAKILRVHDVKEAVEVVRIIEQLK